MIGYPRHFEGDALREIAFPLGGVGAGCISIGGRGELRDWEIFNRPSKGRTPFYAFAGLWTRDEAGVARARVLEGPLQPPYGGAMGLGSQNAPGLRRMESARFSAEFPVAEVLFEDRQLPVEAALRAFGPFVPHDADASGAPFAVLRYHVRNPGPAPVEFAVAHALDNPIGAKPRLPFEQDQTDSRVNSLREDDGALGILMANSAMPAELRPEDGTIALAYLREEGLQAEVRTGWPRTNWWEAPQAFWDAFAIEGRQPKSSERETGTGSIGVRSQLQPGETRAVTFLIAWHFPNRTPRHCGWRAPAGHEDDIIGNWYANRFEGAWDVVSHAAATLPALEPELRSFQEAVRASTVPDVLKEAAMANLSTLVTPTCFRAADGRFHAFEGCFDDLGSCWGDCTHVWNYEVATQNLFPDLARSLRETAFGYPLDEDGAMRCRALLPEGIERFEYAAADGQAGQIVKTYYDWQLSGDDSWLGEMWPAVRRALEFCWLPGSWDADRDGVMEGVQHSTYDIELCGPNPQCQLHYLGALRAGEEMARHLGEDEFAELLAGRFRSGAAWTDANLFNGEYYVQQVRPADASTVLPSLRSPMGAGDLSDPSWQLSEGCLVDQMAGQYLAEIVGLGPLLSEDNLRSALGAIYANNLVDPVRRQDVLQRTFALNDEAGLVVASFPRGERPPRPLPYFGEVMTGLEYSAAVLMLARGMSDEGLACFANIRNRYDGRRRNPWDEAEAGHHYARAMAAWSAMVVLSGFRFSAPRRHLRLRTSGKEPEFRAFWSTATGWGSWSHHEEQTRIEVLHGSLELRTIDASALGPRFRTMLDGQMLTADESSSADLIRFATPLLLVAGSALRLIPDHPDADASLPHTKHQEENRNHEQ
ncbi:MAG: hypothetical protein JSS97_03785 [Actinobacteria bacterium]|nr:hypothetical protein [Actinomycetota bacterium]